MQLNIFNSQEYKGSIFLTCNIYFNEIKGLCYVPAIRYIVKVSVSINQCAFMFEVNVRKELHSQFVSKYHNNSFQQIRAVGTGGRGAHCVLKWGFMWTLPGNQEAKLK